MRRTLVFVIIAGLFLCSSASLAAPHASEQAAADFVVVSIDDEPYTLSDLKQFVKMQGNSEELRSGAFDMRKRLREFVIQQLLEKEAKSSGITVSEKDIAAYIEEIKRQNGVDEAGFQELLKQRGMTFDGYKNQITSDILKTRIMSTRLRSRVSVSDEDVKRYLKENPQLLPKEGSLHLQQIFIPNSQPAAEAELEGIRAAVLGGAAFAEAGTRYFLDLGYINPEDLLPELRAVAEETAPGKVTGIVRTENGYSILLVADRRSSTEQEVSPELMQTVRKELTEKKLREEAEKYLGDELWKKYNVEVKI